MAALSIGVTRGPADLTAPPDDSEATPLRYGLGTLFQVAPRRVALLANVRQLHVPCIDYENGADLFVFDDLSPLSPDRAVTVSRNHRQLHPETGRSIIVAEHVKVCGFVPLGAKLDDGSPHPHAGTGFIVGRAYGFAADHSTRLWNELKPPFRCMLLMQLRFDGTTLAVTRTERLLFEPLLPGWDVIGCGLSGAVLDGEDLLFGLTVRSEGQQACAGVGRWRRGPEGWRPVSFTPVTPAEGFGEPTIVRDHDGRLLLAARQGLHDQPILKQYSLAVWRSADADALRWEQVIDVPAGRSHVPVILNKTADGQPYLVSSPHDPEARDASGRVISIWSRRQHLLIWPLSSDRRSLGEPITLRDTADFGPAPTGRSWYADHAMGSTVQLADGNWRHMVCYRVRVSTPARTDVERATPATGCYIEELTTEGQPIPAWRF